MGLNLCWIAVQTGQKAAVFDGLGFEEIGEVGDEIGVDYSCAELPGGWLVLVATNRSFDMGQALAKSSTGGFALGCEMSETVMVSEARALEGGSLLWSVVHDPDRDDHDVTVQGAPPPQFDEIRQRLQAEQATPGNETVDYLFDLPVELAVSVCGYRAGQTCGLKWSVLQKKAPSRNKAPSRRPKSLSAAMKAELLPLLKSLGWSLANDPPGLSDPGEIVRRMGNQEQQIWFDFGSGQETYITTHFRSWESISTTSGYAVSGRSRNAPVRLPLWKRFTWTHLRELTRPFPVADDPVRAAIDKAKDEILAVDRFLRTNEAAPCVYVGFAGPVERKAEH